MRARLFTCTAVDRLHTRLYDAPPYLYLSTVGVVCTNRIEIAIEGFARDARKIYIYLVSVVYV